MMGRMLRPKKTVLESTALVPGHNLLNPAPNVFTHVLAVDAPFYYAVPKPDEKPCGTLHKGARVLLVRDHGEGWSAIADQQGLYVVVKTSSLKAVDPARRDET